MKQHITCTCGARFAANKATYIGTQEAFLPGRPDMAMYNCPHCGSTHTVKLSPERSRERLLNS